MAENTNIEWCDSTWNGWIGCTKVSRGESGGGGCDHCYAEVSTPARTMKIGWGAGQPRHRTAPATWNMPYQWNDQPFCECMDCGWRGESRKAKAVKNPAGFHPPIEQALICPGCSKVATLKAARRRVFCMSLADVFDNEVPGRWRIDLLELIARTPNLDWLLLTKRIGNAHHMLNVAASNLTGGLPTWWNAEAWPNVWLGATIVNQPEYDRDIGKLLRTPAAVHFLSVEPMLGAIDMRMGGASMPDYSDHRPLPKLDWMIVGGESGPGARPLYLQWVRDIVRHCRAAGVSVLVKQLGREVMDDGMSSPGEHWPPSIIRRPMPRVQETDPGFVVRLQHAKGGDPAEWPEDLRVREVPA